MRNLAGRPRWAPSARLPIVNSMPLAAESPACLSAWLSLLELMADRTIHEAIAHTNVTIALIDTTHVHINKFHPIIIRGLHLTIHIIIIRVRQYRLAPTHAIRCQSHSLSLVI